MAIRNFVGYRTTPPDEYQARGTANPPTEPQYEGTVYSDGSVAIRWLTEFRSHSVWPDFKTFYEVHGHPEYGTLLQWYEAVPCPDQFGEV